MQYLPQSSPCMNPSNSSAARVVVIRGMGEDLYNAAIKGSEEVIKTYRDFLGSQLTATGKTVLHLHVGVPASKGGIPKMEFIQTVLHYEGSLLLQKNEDDEIPLHLAARFGHVNALEVFISKANVMGAGCLREMLMTTDRIQDTALHLAARWNKVEIVSTVLAVDVSCQYARNKDGESPLSISAERSYTNVVAKILDACESPTYGGTLGRTALHAAVALEHEGMMYQMLEKNNTLLRSQDDKGQTPLHYAAGFRRNTADCGKILAILLQYDDRSSHSSTVYIRDNEGRTALHLAILYGSFLRIKALINHRLDCGEIRDNKGQNLFHYAVNSGSLHTIRYLLREGIFSKLLNQRDQEGNTPLHLLATPLNLDCLIAFTRDKDVDLMVSNSENQIAGEILYSQAKLPFLHVVTGVPKSIYRLAPSGVEPDKSQLTINLDKNEEIMLKLKKKSEVYLIMATIIATVSFAAGIALPGGFNQDLGADQGTTLLSRQTAFRAFLVSDAVALSFSAIAILLCLHLTMLENALIVRILYHGSQITTSISLESMMVAFMTGTLAIVYQSGHTVRVITFLFICFTIYYTSHLIGLPRTIYLDMITDLLIFYMLLISSVFK